MADDLELPCLNHEDGQASIIATKDELEKPR